MDPMDMNEEEYLMYRARERAAAIYRAHGYGEFADRIEACQEDDCVGMRLARFFLDNSPPDPEYVREFERLAEDEAEIRKNS